jgi:RimK family alpha-L-glutamate ligase
MSVALLGSSANTTNVELVEAWRGLGVDARLVAPTEASRLGERTAVVARLDVLPTLDGVEPGLLELLGLGAGGARVLNGARSLVAAHDKLVTARLLEAAGLPHPRTVHVRAGEIPALSPPLVVKPRFGSWGRDVFRCETWADISRVLREVRERSWFRRHGALLQELVPPRGYDLRLIVAGEAIVGAVERVSAPGEWRTNISLGGSVRAVEPTREACELGFLAARAIGADFVGVDLLTLDDGSAVVLELNGAVEFDGRYSLSGRDTYADAACALSLVPAPAAVTIVS